MTRGPVFSIGGIPVRVDPSFLLVVVLLGLLGPIELLVPWVLVVTISVLIHELGHAVAFRSFGHAASVQLYGFGGLTTGARLTPGRNLVVSLAGPVTGIVALGVPAVLVERADLVTDPYWQLVVTLVVWVNVFWSLLNLLPVLPLDGGNVTQALIQLATGRDSERPARIISIAFAGAAALLALAYGLLFGVVFAGIFVALNWSALGRERQQQSAAVLARGQRALVAGDTRGAIESGEGVLAGGAGNDTSAAALELQIWAWLAEGNVANARLTAARYPPNRQPSSTLRGALALVEGRHDEGVALLTYGFVHEPAGPDKLFAAITAARVGQIVPLAGELLAMADGRGVDSTALLTSLLHHAGWFDAAAAVGDVLYRDGRAPRARTAYNVACSLARAGHRHEALGWLRVALEQGWDDPGRLTSDEDLAGVRALPEFVQLRGLLPRAQA